VSAIWTVGTVEPADARRAFDPGRAPFAVRVLGEVIPYEEFAISVMPGESVELEVVEPSQGEQFELTAEAGTVTRLAPRRWSWRAPAEPGLSRLDIERVSDRDDEVELNAFVMVPARLLRDGVLNGYRIGAYPSQPYKGNPLYTPPKGFVEVTGANIDTKVAPHFTLRQFVCKQAGGFPKYLLLHERLILKLEWLLEQLNARNVEADGFAFISGYRTPFYNRAIGNTTTYSAHVFGGAADIYIDEDGDRTMDDVNRDGRSDRRDAEFLAALVQRLTADSPLFEGGIGIYGATPAHGPYIHVDARGTKARW
jgi:hypothetical protein